MTILKIYTDGACSGNQNEENSGGWGAVLEYGSHRKEMSGSEKDTTNNRMEMTALIRAFEAIKKDSQQIEVFSDSSYLINCFKEKWYENWRKNDWKTSGKKPVVNRDLWEELLPYIEKHKIRFNRVKGHIDLSGKKTDAGLLFKNFLEWNGGRFTMDEFTHAVEMNNLADALANKAILSARQEAEAKSE